MPTTQFADATDTVDIDDEVFARLSPIPYEIFSVDTPNQVLDPSWSPDGTQIIFAKNIAGTWSIETVDAAATPTHSVLYTGPLVLADPTFSDDGFFIMFAEQTAYPTGGIPYGSWRIRYMNSDGSGLTTIIDDGNANQHPVWVTPTQIAFQSWQNGVSTVFEISLIDLAGQGRIDLGPGEYPRMVAV